MTFGERIRRIATRYLSHLVVIALIIVIFAVGSVVSDRVATWRNIANLLQQLAVLGLLSLGQTVAILTGGIDLSIGQIVGTGTVFFAHFTENFPDLVWLAVLLVLIGGGLIGALNGALVTILRVHPLIVTLGVSSLLLGATYLYTRQPSGSVPDSVIDFAYGQAFGVPLTALLTFAAFAATAAWLRFTRSGRAIYFVGGNPDAARLLGIPTGRVLTYTYAFSGVCAALAAIFLAARMGVGDPVIGSTLTLQSITPVVIGGTLLSGGRGGVSGTILGVFLLSLMANILNYLQVSSYAQWIIQGFVILIAVGIHKPDLSLRRA
jgi:ribose/xylose/arabinose/galactoside ABC-type transport system permease subunit